MNQAIMNRRCDSTGVAIDALDVRAYKVPSDAPESDGTYEWCATTLVVVEVTAGGATGLGYTYADTLPLVTLLGAARDAIADYGSGGFTSYTNQQLQEQFVGWVNAGITRVKMKIGRDRAADVQRVRAARQAIGKETELFVDANGAYSRKQALASAREFAGLGVTWFEEPVSSDDLDGLRLIREEGPPGMDIAAGEYGYDLFYFRTMLEADAVDVLQADVTRCGGITEFLRVGALCQTRSMPLSAHCAPTLHLHAACTLPNIRHLEYFHDHDRIEHMLLEGAPVPRDGKLSPDLSRSGLGIEFKRQDAQRYAI